MVAIGLGGNVALADAGNTDNNGNHYGWYKQSGSTNYSSVRYSSVPEPDSLAFIGAGLAGIGIWRRCLVSPNSVRSTGVEQQRAVSYEGPALFFSKARRMRAAGKAQCIFANS